MSTVSVDQLSPEQKDELLCTYAALVLHDDGAEVTTEGISNMIKASGNVLDAPYWPMMFSKLVNDVCMEALIKMGSGAGGGGGGGGGGAAAATAGPGGDSG